MSSQSMLDSAMAAGWFGAGLPSAAREHLAALADIASHTAGTTILREGQTVDSFGVVVEGRLAIRLAVPGRADATIQTIEPGDCIGWSALVPPHRATSTIVAIERTTVITLDGAALRDALDADPILAAAVYRRVLDAVARRLTATRTQLLDLFARADQEPW